MRPLEHELLVHAKALRALARVLVGERHADDVVQDTTLHVLARQQPAPSRSWLLGVLRHRAAKLLRGEGRRARREAASLPPEPPPSPQQMLEHKETLQRLTAALTSLPEPYATALWLRFFDDLKPAAIAARTGEPLATVKSRLQRGLAMLRERLDADRGFDWRAGLVAAFGGERITAATAAAASTGVLLMATATKVAVSAMALGLCAWWLLSPEAPTRQPVAAAGHSQPTSIATTTVQAGGTDLNNASLQRVVPTASTAASPATIVGRCIDKDGIPLADCTLQLAGGDRSSDSVRSDAEGRFALPCRPSTAAIEFRATAAGRGGAILQLPGIAASQVVDIGDLELARTRKVHVRTVDRHGQAVPRAFVCLGSRPMVRTDGMGAVTMQVETGRESVQTVPPAAIESLDVPEGDGVWEAVIPLADETARLEGVVVDEAGAAIPSAGVRAEALEPTAGSSSGAWTATDGAFALARPRGRRDSACRLVITATGFEPSSLEDVPWNARALHIVLRRGLGIELHVRGVDGRPVEGFTAWICVRPDATTSRLRVAGTFPDGVARIAGACRGHGHVSVLPTDGALSPRLFVPVELSDDSSRIDLVLQPLARRQLVVRYQDGSPVPAAMFELLQAGHGGRPALTSWAGRFRGESSSWEGGAHNRHAPPAVLLQAGSTDGDGRAVLCGPPDEPLALRLRSVQTRLLDGVSLTDPNPLQFEIRLGGGVRGRIGPPELVSRIEAMLRQRHVEPARARPSVRLVPEADVDEDSRTQSPIAVAADGTFERQGLGTGTWRLIFDLRRMDAGVFAWRDVGTVRVLSGVTAVQDAEFPDLMPCALHGFVTVDGMAARRAQLLLSYADGAGRGFSTRHELAADGGFDALLIPATYRPGLALFGVDGTVLRNLSAATELRLEAGSQLRQDFEFVSASLRIHLCDARGRPAVGVKLELEKDGRFVARSPVTDIAGDTEMLLMPATYKLFAWRLDLQDEQMARAFRSTRPTPEQLSQARFDLGPVELPPGKPIEREIRLPEAWER